MTGKFNQFKLENIRSNRIDGNEINLDRRLIKTIVISDNKYVNNHLRSSPHTWFFPVPQVLASSSQFKPYPLDVYREPLKNPLRKFPSQSWKTILTCCVLTTFGPLPCPNAESTGPRVPWPLSSCGSIPWPPCPPPPTPCPPPPLPVEVSRKQFQLKTRLLLWSILWHSICERPNYNLLSLPQPCFESEMEEVGRMLAPGENNRLSRAVQIARGVCCTDCQSCLYRLHLPLLQTFRLGKPACQLAAIQF